MYHLLSISYTERYFHLNSANPNYDVLSIEFHISCTVNTKYLFTNSTIASIDIDFFFNRVLGWFVYLQYNLTIVAHWRVSKLFIMGNMFQGSIRCQPGDNSSNNSADALIPGKVAAIQLQIDWSYTEFSYAWSLNEFQWLTKHDRLSGV